MSTRLCQLPANTPPTFVCPGNPLIWQQAGRQATRQLLRQQTRAALNDTEREEQRFLCLFLQLCRFVFFFVVARGVEVVVGLGIGRDSGHLAENWHFHFT